MPKFHVPIGDGIHTFEDLPKRAGIRFAIGDPAGPRSSTWRLWGTPAGDVYLAIRHLGGVTKLSLHRDRNCHIGYTSEFMKTSEGQALGRSRHWGRWRLPDAPAVNAVHIICPNEDLALPVEREEEPELMRWLPAPGAGRATVTTVHVAEPPDESGWQGAASRGELVGYMECQTRTTWLTSISQQLGPNERALIDAWRTRGTQAAGDEAQQPGARMLQFGGNPPQETPFLVELRPEIKPT